MEEDRSEREPDEWVVLNVGGVRYETYASTLTKYSETMLWAMFKKRDQRFKVSRNAQGEYLIDRNGRCFEAVLEYLRSGVFFVPPGVSESMLENEFEYFGLPWRNLKMVDQLVFAKWAARCRELFSACSVSLLAHLKSAHEQGHEEVGINLVPEAAAESDERYLELRGHEIGTVWAPNEQSPVINILAWSTIDKSFLSLLCKRFQSEGFQVVMGTKANYFKTSSYASLLFLVVSWKNVHFTLFGKLVETVEDIATHVETMAMSTGK